MGLCVEDEDCSPLDTNRLCYANISGFEDSIDAKGCACNSYFGWTGDDCDTLSSSSYITLATTIICIILSFIVFVRSLVMLRLIWGMNVSQERTTGSSGCWAKLNPRVVTNIYAALAGFGLLLWASAVMINTLLVDGDYWAPFYAPIDPFKGRASALILVGGPLGIFFTIWSVVNVAIMWLDVAYKTINMNPYYTKVINQNRRFLYGLQVFTVVLALLVFGYERLADGGTSVTGLFYPIIILIVIIWYGLACYKLSMVLKGHTSSLLAGGSGSTGITAQKAVFKKILYKIRYTTLVIISMLLGYMISNLIYSIQDTFMGSWKEASAVGEFQLAKASHHGQIVFATLSVLTINSYLVKSLNDGGGYTTKFGFIWRNRNEDLRVDSSLMQGDTKNSERNNSKFSLAFPSPGSRWSASRGKGSTNEVSQVDF